MADLPEDQKRTMVIEACQSAYAHDFIETLPNVSSDTPFQEPLLTLE